MNDDLKIKQKAHEKYFSEKLHYDGNTGILTWKAKVKNAEIGAEAGCKIKNGYRVVNCGKVQFKSHRVAWFLHYGNWPLMHIDHINGVRDDNRIENLRDVSRSVNLQNLRKATARNSCGELGAYPQHKGWAASISVNGKRMYLGYFKTKTEASNAYVSAKRKFHEGCSI